MKKLLMLLLLAGCSAPPPANIYYGETYKVKSGFYKGCVGQADLLVEGENGYEVLLNPLTCRNGRFSNYFKPDNLEHQDVTIQEK